MSDSDTASNRITFRPLERSDFPLLQVWLNTRHVRDGWFSPDSFPPDGYSLEQVTTDFSPDLSKDSPITPLIIECDGVPIGYVQVWCVQDFLEYAAEFIDDDTPASEVVSFDTFIGDENYVGRGLLPTILDNLLKEHVFRRRSVSSVIINPDSNNRRAIGAYEKYGFRHTHTLAGPDGKSSSYIMRIDRNQFFDE